MRIQTHVKKIGSVLTLALALSLGSTGSASAVLPTLTTTFSPISTTWGVGVVALTPPTSNSSGAWSYASSNTSVATIVGSVASINNIGTTTITATQSATSSYETISVSAIMTVGAGAPTLGTFTAINAQVSDTPITLIPPTSNSAGTWTFISLNTNIASISGDKVLLKAAGVVAITATQAANWNWDTASVATTINISGPAPSFGVWPNLVIALGTSAPFTITPPTSNSTGAWTYTIDAPDLATLVGNVLTPKNVGTISLTGIQAASSTFGLGIIRRNVTITGNAPTLGEFKSFVHTLKMLESNAITLAAPGSNSAGIWVFASSDSTILRVEGDKAIASRVGSVTLTAIQSASGNYSQSNSISATVQILGALPITNSLEPLTAVFGAPPITLKAPASTSAGAWTFASSNSDVATIEANILTIKGAGSSTIKATQAADWNWGEKATEFILTVGKATPSVATLLGATLILKSAPSTLTDPTSNSTSAWIYTSSNPAVVKVVGKTIEAVSVGAAVVTGKQVSSTNFIESVEVSAEFKVIENPTIVKPAAIVVKFGDPVFTITAPTSNSSGPWSYESTNPLVVTIADGKATIVGAGSAVIKATQVGIGSFTAGTVELAVVVEQGVAVIGALTPITIKFGGPVFTITAPTSTSSGTWSYTSSDPLVLTIADGKATIVGAGNTTIKATQAASGNFKAGTVELAVVVEQSVAVIGAITPITIKFGGPVFTITAPTSTSTGPWSYESTNPLVLTIADGKATIVGAGNTTIKATQAASSNFKAGTVELAVVVEQGVAVIGAMAPISIKFGAPAFTITAPLSTSSGTWSYTSSDPLVLTIADGKVTIVGAGSAVIKATQAASGNFTAETVELAVVVEPEVTVIGAMAPISIKFGGPAFTITAPTSTSSGTWSYESTNPLVLTITEGKVTIVGAGSAVIKATQAASGNYSVGASELAVVVEPAVAVIGAITPISIKLGNPAFTITAPTSTSTGAWTFTSSDRSKFVIENGQIRAVAAGSATLNAAQSATTNYAAITTSVTVIISPKPIVKPTVKISSKKRVITVSVVGGPVTVTINGKVAKVGKNTVKVGRNTVRVYAAGGLIISKTITTK